MTNLLAFKKVYQGANLLKDCYVGDTHVAHMYENLFTNPSFETPGAAQTLFTNLFTNPSFETASGSTVEVRRNKAKNPSAISSGSMAEYMTRYGWSRSFLTSGGPGGLGPVSYCRITVSGGSVGPGRGIDMYGNPDLMAPGTTGEAILQPVTSGQQYTASVWVRASKSASALMRHRLHDGAGAWLADTQYGPTTTLTASAWTRISYTFTASATGYVFLRAEVDATGWVSTDTFDMTGLLIEDTGVLLPYFDGSYSPDSDLTAAWTGTANDSASILSGTPVAGVGDDTAELRTLQSSQWSNSGAKSLRVFATSAGGDALSQINFTNGAGKTYTVSFSVRVPETLTTKSSCVIQENSGDYTTYLNLLPSGTVLTPGTTRYSGTFTVPSADTGNFRFIIRGATEPGKSIWYDDFMLVEGSYDPGYFDGSAPPKVRRNLALEPGAKAQAAVNQSFKIGPTWFGGSGGSGTTTWNNTGSGIIGGPDTYARKTFTALPSGVAPAIANDVSFTLSDLVRVTPGMVFTVSYWWRTSAPGLNVNVNRIYYLFQDANGVQVGGGNSSPDFAFPGENTWQRVYHTITVPAGVASILVSHGLYLSGVEIGDTVDGTGLLVERSDTLGSYFDGTTSPDSNYLPAWEGTANASPSYLYDRDFTAAWSGTAHASTSMVKAVRPAGFRQLWNGSMFKSAGGGIRLMNLSSGGPRAILQGLDCPLLLPATTYTIRAIITNNTGVTINNARLLGAGWWFAYVSATLADGETREIRGTFTTPSDFTSDYLAVGVEQEVPVGGEIRIRDLMIVEGEYTGDYFDGDTPDPSFPNSGKPFWTGAAHASTSKLWGAPA